jgi:hypothetical protein
VEAAGVVGAVLVEHKADEALHPGQEHAAVLEPVLVLEGELAEGTGGLGTAGKAPLRARAAGLLSEGSRRRQKGLLTSIGKGTLP